MKNKLISILLIIILAITLTGCGNDKVSVEDDSNENINNVNKEVSTNKGDNPELVDTFNNAISKLYDEAKEEGRFELALYNVTDKISENGVNKYKVLALCDTAFTKKVDLDSWTYTEEKIPDYNGKCTYDTWEFTTYYHDKDYNILVLDTNNDYYNVTLSFKKITFNDKTKYYPTFSDSKLLK